MPPLVSVQAKQLESERSARPIHLNAAKKLKLCTKPIIIIINYNNINNKAVNIPITGGKEAITAANQ